MDHQQYIATTPGSIQIVVLEEHATNTPDKLHDKRESNAYSRF